MLFDSTLLFWHTGNVYNMTSGEAVSLAGLTASTSSAVINLGNPRDLGIGMGAVQPNIEVSLMSAVTASSASLALNFQFQGSTDSVNWTTYIETGALTTASLGAGVNVLRAQVPPRPPGTALPLYYRMNVALSGSTSSVSSGALLGGIILAQAQSAGTLGQYPAGFTVS